MVVRSSVLAASLIGGCLLVGLSAAGYFVGRAYQNQRRSGHRARLSTKARL